MAKYLRLLGRIALRTVQAVAFYLLWVYMVIAFFDELNSAAFNSAFDTYLAGASVALAAAVLALGGVWGFTGVAELVIMVLRRKPITRESIE